MTALGPKAIVFDFDGVIVESLSIKTDAFRELFADRPEHVDRIVRLHEDNLGVSRYRKFEIIYREFLGRDLPDEELRRLDRRFSQLVFEGVVACPYVSGALELLERLAGGHRLYVASATPQAELERIVDARGLAHLFAAVYGSPRAKSAIVASILEDDALAPVDALFVGDAMTDYEAASANRLRFVGRARADVHDPFAGIGVEVVADLAELDRRWSEIVLRLGWRA